MADYQLTPYALQVTPVGDPKSPRRMGNLRGDAVEDAVSALAAVRNTFVALSREQDPRQRSDDKTRKLDVQSVTGVANQVACVCLLGITGFNSRLQLAALDVPAVREFSDAEWFDLRVLFAAAPSARTGILIVESVGTFGIGKHIGDLLKNSIRHSVDTNLMVRVEAIQEALTLGQSLADLETRAVEFRTLVKGSDTSDNAALGGKSTPFSKVVKITRRGGLGRFAQFKGKSTRELAGMYGLRENSLITDETTASAQVVMPNGRPRKVNVEEGTPSSITFPIDRSNPESRPTDAEFYAAAAEVVEDVKQGVGLANLSIVDPAQQPNVDLYEDLVVNWTVTDETPAS